MRSKLMLTLTASAAALLLALGSQPVWAQDEPALTGTVSSEAEGNMEGVVVTAAQPGSIIRVSVTTDAQGRYVFPQNRLLPGEYTISIRAVGYEIDAPTKAVVEAEKTITTDIRPKKTKKSCQSAHKCRVDDEHPWHGGGKGRAAQLHWLPHTGTDHAVDARSRRVDACHFPHDGLRRGESADQAAAHAG